MKKSTKTKSNKKVLKIAMVLDDTLDRNAGAQVYVLTLGDYLEKLGHDVHYIVGETNKKIRNKQYSLAKNIKVKFSGNHMSIPYYTSKKEVKLLLENERFDAIHVQTPFSPIMAGKVIKQAHGHSKIVVTFHILPYGRISRISNRVFGLWLKYFYNQYFDHYACITEPSQKFSEEYYGIAGEIIRYPVNLSEIKKQTKSKLPKGKRIDILFHGRLEERKGCLELVKTLAQAKNTKVFKNEWFLHISGDGPERSKIEKFVDANDLKQNVKFYGRTTDKRKFQLMNMADITVYPASGGESFGVVLVEAMGSGHTVVLAGNNPGYSSVLDKTPEALFDPKNPEEFLKKLTKYVNNKQARKRLYDKQQKLVKDYDVKKIAKQMVRLYSR